LATMADIAATLAEVDELLTVLTAKIESATTVEEMPALIDDARETARSLLRSCLASETEHLLPEEAGILHVELTKLGDALEAQIAGIIDQRWAQLTGGSASLTRH
jgi:hypothetical protein